VSASANPEAAEHGQLEPGSLIEVMRANLLPISLANEPMLEAEGRATGKNIPLSPGATTLQVRPQGFGPALSFNPTPVCAGGYRCRRRRPTK